MSKPTIPTTRSEFDELDAHFSDTTVKGSGVLWRLPRHALELIVGLNASGQLVAEDESGFRWTLTECCYASLKGSMGAVVCRSCYAEQYEYDESTELRWRLESVSYPIPTGPTR